MTPGPGASLGRTVVLDPLTDPRWTDLLARTPDAAVFHHPAWLALLHRTYRYPIGAVVALDAQGAPTGGVPLAAVASRLTGRRLVSVPFADAVPPLLAPGAGDDVLDALAAGVEAERRRRGSRIELRWRVPEAGTPVDRFHLHVIPLDGGIEVVERRFRKSVQRNVRTAERAGVVVERGHDRAALDVFYALHVPTRRKLGAPTQPRSFIRGLEPLLAGGNGFVSIARLDGRPVAASVFLSMHGTLLLKYAASAADALGVRPNNAVMADTLRWACANDMSRLDLGRTDLGQEGLRRFKRSWGAGEETIAYTYAGGSPSIETDGRGGKALEHLIQRSPPVVSRAVGALLYRHAG